ncbi:MAG TPA: hypothetical protein PLQ61_02365 [Bacteroidales bacterium]|nr:hypothetical protein [Bacteroidales bacterium]HQG36337.1 hypothetical protein [Bacteroidales bacterium]HQG52479.1 hypothetical protein [Bacteroidales bacterium]HQJ20030.1 hypothetical protein [Bacteroidales bacterium]HRC88991.1 hypothetical protein [Bacteroidales bacterium]
MRKWENNEIEILNSLNSPQKIQDFLDSIEYNPEYECKSPRWVIRRRKAHCFEGAIFAASALRFIGFKPLLVDMKSYNDDDHVIAVYKIGKHWGAVAKSNFTLLRFREPVYRSIRELIMSYFDFYYNTKGEKTLRSYSLPLNLSAYDSRNWETTDEDLEYIGEKIEKLHHFEVVTPEMIARLNHVSEAVFRAGLLGSNEAGLFKPR